MKEKITSFNIIQSGIHEDMPQARKNIKDNGSVSRKHHHEVLLTNQKKINNPLKKKESKRHESALPRTGNANGQ